MRRTKPARVRAQYACVFGCGPQGICKSWLSMFAGHLWRGEHVKRGRQMYVYTRTICANSGVRARVRTCECAARSISV